MAKTRKKNGEAILQHFQRPGFPGIPGIPGEMGIALATAYVPPQVFRDMYNLTEALNKGTLFPELDRPYTPMAPMV